MSLRDRARAAAREQARQARGADPLTQHSAAALSEVLECEVDPLLCRVRVEFGATYVEADVDDIRVRTSAWEDDRAPWPPKLEVETGRNAARRWREFKSLADLDALLD